MDYERPVKECEGIQPQPLAASCVHCKFNNAVIRAIISWTKPGTSNHHRWH